MKIQLTQDEIKAAIANYVSGTIGIDLTNNDLAITFSATRYEGTIANLEITPKAFPVTGLIGAGDAVPSIPGYSDNTAVTETVTAEVPEVVAAAEEPVADPADAEVAAEAQADATLGDTLQEAATEVKPAVKSTATLFGKPTAA